MKRSQNGSVALISADNEMENHHFPKLKFWKKCKILIFTKSCLKSFWWCFSANPLVWGYFECVFWLSKPQNTFFGHREAYFCMQKYVKVAKFGSKMPFLVGKNAFFNFETNHCNFKWLNIAPNVSSNCLIVLKRCA